NGKRHDEGNEQSAPTHRRTVRPRKLKHRFDNTPVLSTRLMSMQTSLQAVSNPHRREILRLVWDAEMSSREIASHFDVTWQTVSHNLRVLREAGLVSERRDGTRRLYRTARDELGPLEALLRGLWRQDLKRLEKVIEHDRAEGIAE